jgi:hypothetical protein
VRNPLRYGLLVCAITAAACGGKSSGASQPDPTAAACALRPLVATAHEDPAALATAAERTFRSIGPIPESKRELAVVLAELTEASGNAVTIQGNTSRPWYETLAGQTVSARISTAGERLEGLCAGR